MNKVCGRCKNKKDISQFGMRGSKISNSRRLDFKSWCYSCCNQDSHEMNRANKIAAFEHYGGIICSCCKITEPDFLSLDHMSNDGTEMRKTHGTGTAFYRWLKRNNYPDLNLQVSCHNCNHGRFINGGVCPHQK
jgi:hypothetical protein